MWLSAFKISNDHLLGFFSLNFLFKILVPFSYYCSLFRIHKIITFHISVIGITYIVQVVIWLLSSCFLSRHFWMICSSNYYLFYLLQFWVIVLNVLFLTNAPRDFVLNVWGFFSYVEISTMKQSVKVWILFFRMTLQLSKSIKNIVFC